MELNLKIINGLERISEVFKTLLWEKAKVYGVSPIQIQIVLFIYDRQSGLCNVSSLAKEFNLTKATISDAVRVLIKKEFLIKDHSPTDNRRFNLLLTQKGRELFSELTNYSLPVTEELEKLNETEQNNLFATIAKLIYQLNQKGIIQVQRTCFNCRFYKGDKDSIHYCDFLDKELANFDLQLDCSDFEN